jgi:hypothetical protein
MRDHMAATCCATPPAYLCFAPAICEAVIALPKWSLYAANTDRTGNDTHHNGLGAPRAAAGTIATRAANQVPLPEQLQTPVRIGLDVSGHANK